MRILNFGSLNLDYVYNVDHFVRPGETLAALSRTVKAGGKGLNQSVALARAGACVSHAGCIGAGGESLKILLEENGVIGPARGSKPREVFLKPEGGSNRTESGGTWN